MRVKLSHLPSRIAAGVFIVNSGVAKLKGGEETAVGTHGFATGAYPFLGKLKAEDFTRLLGITEVALGTALLVPVVPSAVAGAGLTAFSGGLLGLYARTPGMHKENSFLPTEQGLPLFKDSWLFGLGLTLMLDDLL
jgi:hypothetical protein